MQRLYLNYYYNFLTKRNQILQLVYYSIAILNTYEIQFNYMNDGK